MDLARELTDFLGAVEQRLGSTLVDGNAGPDVKGDTARLREAWLDWGRRQGLIR